MKQTELEKFKQQLIEMDDMARTLDHDLNSIEFRKKLLSVLAQSKKLALKQ